MALAPEAASVVEAPRLDSPRAPGAEATAGTHRSGAPPASALPTGVLRWAVDVSEYHPNEKELERACRSLLPENEQAEVMGKKHHEDKIHAFFSRLLLAPRAAACKSSQRSSSHIGLQATARRVQNPSTRIPKAREHFAASGVHQDTPGRGRA